MNLTESHVRRYAGDISPAEAWEVLKREPRAQLVDVRTAAEWDAGIPDLSTLGRETLLVEWQHFPGSKPNSSFAGQAAEQLRAAGAGTDTPVLFLCRSGGRSRSAAIAMSDAGFSQALNVAGGFEGSGDDGHRETPSGWKAAGLPWRRT